VEGLEMTRYEQGSTLIVVLMIVLLITIVGTLAIRQSISSLKLVSNNQMQTLLLQNADAVLVRFQQPETTQRIAGANGIVGFFKNEDNWNKELVFCFKGIRLLICPMQVGCIGKTPQTNSAHGD
jgi:Tfp pilus assembly protein PilE